MNQKFNNWITCPAANPDARLRLFCLPFAGGGASAYRPWAKLLLPAIELCPIQLPGRENRLRESPYTDIVPLIEALADQIKPYLDKPYALYGHSMGALLAFELTRTLQRQNAPLPLTLFLAARRAAHLPPRRPPIYSLPDPELIQALRHLGGWQEEITEHQELLDILLPTLRADLTLGSLYRYSADTPLHCPLQLYTGRDDPDVPPDDMEAWREHSTQSSSLRIFSGGHSFLRSHRDALLEAITSSLAQAGCRQPS
jgi:medium-chain acyl-[acyl-carrier-protein] hydrolase